MRIVWMKKSLINLVYWKMILNNWWKDKKYWYPPTIKFILNWDSITINQLLIYEFYILLYQCTFPFLLAYLSSTLLFFFIDGSFLTANLLFFINLWLHFLILIYYIYSIQWSISMILKLFDSISVVLSCIMMRCCILWLSHW